MKELLLQASAEIKLLRRQNEILSAKVEMIDLFACLLFTQPARRSESMGEDIAWKLDKAIDQLQEEEKIS